MFRHVPSRVLVPVTASDPVVCTPIGGAALGRSHRDEEYDLPYTRYIKICRLSFCCNVELSVFVRNVPEECLESSPTDAPFHHHSRASGGELFSILAASIPSRAIGDDVQLFRVSRS